MNTTAPRKVVNGKPLAKVSYVRIGESVDTVTGEVFRTYNLGDQGSYRRVRGYVTERWMRNHGWSN